MDTYKYNFESNFITFKIVFVSVRDLSYRRQSNMVCPTQYTLHLFLGDFRLLQTLFEISTDLKIISNLIVKLCIWCSLLCPVLTASFF